MDETIEIANCRCPGCAKLMAISRMSCEECHTTLEGRFKTPPLAQLPEADQAFVVAFVRHHGSLKKMEELFDISYPTVKNRLNAIAARLDSSFRVPATNTDVLERLARGELTVNEALERLE